MSKLAKLGLVMGGVVLACLTAGAAVYAWQSLSQGPAAQASSGMYAFGDLFLFLGVFGVMMLLPMGLALFFLVQWVRSRGAP